MDGVDKIDYCFRLKACPNLRKKVNYPQKEGANKFMRIRNLTRIVGIILIIVTLLLASCGKATPERKTYSAPPSIIIDPGKQYTATIETKKGDLELELFAGDAPLTVNNFVFLAREGFYDGTTFHRVLPDFMAQGGDPTGTGMGGPGYNFADEFSQRTHGTGTLSMANAGPNTNGSQFFITYAPQPHLNGKHSVFGQLTEGTDVLQKLENGDAIKRITIEEK